MGLDSPFGLAADLQVGGHGGRGYGTMPLPLPLGWAATMVPALYSSCIRLTYLPGTSPSSRMSWVL